MELAHSPLFLLILVVAYQGQHIHSTEELLDEYIHKQLHDLNNQGAYPPGKVPSPEQTNHYLSWLASKLEFEGTTEFLIEQMQPSWLDTSLAHKRYRWRVGILIGLFGGLFSGIFAGYFGGLKRGLICGVIGWIIGGTTCNPSDIQVLEKLSFSWSSFYRNGLIGALIGGSIGGVYKGPIGGLMGSLVGGFGYGLKTSRIDVLEKKYPNQGITDSIRNGLIAGLGLGLIGGLVGGQIDGLIGGLFVGLILGLFAGMNYGIDAFFKHLSLRTVLFHSKVSPWNYARFLEHAENHRFIQRTGGRYRFVHDLLRKRFAATLKQP